MRIFMGSAIHRHVALAALGLLLACTTESAKPTVPIGKTGRTGAGAQELSGPPGLPAAELASLAKAPAHYGFAVTDKGGMFVYETEGKIFVQPFAAGPTKSGDPVEVAAVPKLGVALSVRARPDGTFVVFWDESMDQTHVFKLRRVGADGKALGSVVALPPVADAGVSFADVAVAGDRLHVVHTVTRHERESVYVTPISAGLDKVEGPPRLAVDGAMTWFPAESERGIGIVFVRPDDRGAGARQAGSLDFVQIDASGKVGTPRSIVAAPTVLIDVQMVAVRGGYVLGWTDEGPDERAVRVAALGPDGSVISAPAWVAPPIGQQSFVHLVADPRGNGARALVAWENIGQSSGGARIIQLATVAPSGVLGTERTRLLYGDSERPTLVADGDGFAALTAAPAKAEGADGKAAQGADSWPALVRLGADLSVKWSEPVRFPGTLAPDGIPDITANITCAGASCFALAADGASPTKFFVAASADRTNPWKSPAWRAEDERPPKVRALRTVTDGPRLAFAQSSTALPAVAWVTYFLDGTTPVEAPPKGEAPYAATLGVRFSGADGRLLDPVTVSKRAVSLGGVSVTSFPGAKKPEVAIAWVAAEKTGPQVYATIVDGDGKKVVQKKITTVGREKGGNKAGPKPKGKGKGKVEETPALMSSASLGASSVAIAASPGMPGAKGEAKGADGFVLAWVDTRDKNGELYVARLAKDLDKAVPDKRITATAGDASDASIVVRGSDAFIAFSDTRDGKLSDIYFSHLDAFSLKEIDDDGRVYASAGASRSPRLTVVGKKLLLVWIEEDPGGPPKPATLRIAEVDDTGRLVQSPKTVEAPSSGGSIGSITGFGITCGDELATCRIVLSWATAEGRADIGAATLDATGALGPITRLGSLGSGPFAEPSFTFGDKTGTRLFYAEDLGEKGRLRELELVW